MISKLSKLDEYFSVGTNVGDIGIWEVASSEKLTHRSFKDWNSSNRTMAVQV